MTSYTDNYGLSKYDTGDAANLRDQYNASMDIIDKQMKTNNDAAGYAKPVLDAAGLTDTTTAAASKTRWDGAAALAATNEDDIAAIDANLNALHANSVNDAKNLYESIVKTGGDAVWLGDSIAEGYLATSGKSYRDIINNTFGLTPHDYFNGGAGWLSQGTGAARRFDQQADAAAADSSYDHSNVKYIFCIGGVNDFPTDINQGNQIAANVESTLNVLLASFPNATIYLGAYLGGELSSNYCISAGFKYQYVHNKIIEGANLVTSNRVRVFSCWDWCSSRVAFYNTDGLHPSDEGHKYIARNLMAQILGISEVRAYETSYVGFTNDHPGSIADTCWVRECDGIYFIGVEINHNIQSSEIDGNKLEFTAVTLPPYIHAYGGLYKPVDIITNVSGTYYGGDYYSILQQQDRDTPIKLNVSCQRTSPATAGDDIRVNAYFSIPKIGIS